MKNLTILLVIVFNSLFIMNGDCQSSAVALGAWREHVPYRKAIDVAIDNNGLIYCAVSYGLFTYSKNSGELNTLSRLRELSDLEVACIEYDPVSGVLMIAYENSNIDIIYSDKTVVNLPDIKQKNIVGGKHINSILFNNGLAYLSCDFGITVIDLNRKEIKDTYYISLNGTQIIIHDLAFDGVNFLAATDNGLYKANINDPNIFNYTGWTKDITLSEPDANYTSVTSVYGKFFTVKTNPAESKDTILVLDNNQWSVFSPDATEGGHVSSYNNQLYYRSNYRICSLDVNANVIRNVDLSMYNNANLQRGFVDNQGNFLIADFNNGLVIQKPDGLLEFINPGGPSSSAGWTMASHNGTLWVSTGVISGDSPNYSAVYGVFRFSDNHWYSYDYSNDALYRQIVDTHSPATNCVAIDPNDGDHVYIGSWGSGILEYRKEGGVNLYDTHNSTLHPLNADSNKLNVGGITFDSDGNLWAVACGSTKPISVMKKDGTWQDFILYETILTGFSLYNLVIDDYGQKWFCARNSSTGEGVCVFKEADINDPAGGQLKRLSDDVGFGALPDAYVRCLAKDKDGSIWIGTNTGVGVVYNPGNVFSGGNYDAQKIIIQQDGYNQYLLETETVTSIAVDGANRKWFGTYSGGAFLMSADGTKQLLNFNVDNSPIPSNTVTSIAVDDASGEVFISTEKGIISYRGDATEGGDKCNDYFVFPNPVRHEYHGPIAIRGLVANADVKIADVAGNVVYHTKANGGEAIWNGNNFSGERAKTGVYIVFVTNEDGSETCTTKMLFAN